MACPRNKLRIAVLISGSGTNLQAIIDAVHSDYLDRAEIVLVLSNRSKAFGLERAEKATIPTRIHTFKPYRDQGRSRQEYDLDMASMLKEYQPDLIVLAGFMHILSKGFIDQFQPGQIINLHPALPGQFDGAHAIERALEAYKQGVIAHTGIMVHQVVPEVDRGPVLAQKRIDIDASDTLNTLEAKIHNEEHRLLVDVIKDLSERH